MHDLSTPGVWRLLEADRRPSAANESWASSASYLTLSQMPSPHKKGHYYCTCKEGKMPSTAICWPSYDACSAAIELPKTSETRSSTLCCFARLLISPLEYSLLHSLDSKRHESRRLVGTRVVVPPYQPVAQWSEPCSGAHTLRCFPPQPAIATDSFFWALSLSRLCMRCSLELLASRPRPKPERRTTSHSLLL